MKTREEVNAFVEALVELCEKHEAAIFPRKDSEGMYVSVELGDTDPVWLDFKRVDGCGAVLPNGEQTGK